MSILSRRSGVPTLKGGLTVGWAAHTVIFLRMARRGELSPFRRTMPEVSIEELSRLSATELAALIASGDVSSREELEAARGEDSDL